MRLHEIDRENLIKIHRRLVAKHEEGSYRALGWFAERNQEIRFEALCRIGDLSGCSVLDLGCGYGHLKTYLDMRYSGIRYTGIDLTDFYIEYAQKKFASDENASFICGDFSRIALPKSDFVFGTGIFSFNFIGYETYLKEAIRQMYASCIIAVGFNLLDIRELREVEFPPYRLIGNNPKDIRRYCESIAPEVTLIEEGVS